MMAANGEDSMDSARQQRYPAVVCFGEMLVDFVPTVAGASLAESKSYERAPGGAPANVAVAVARLGGKSAMVGKVGDDSFGRMLVKMLDDNGVDSRGMVLDPDTRTALAFITLAKDGERQFMFYRNPGADMMLRVSELHRELISSCVIFHSGSISLTSEPCRSAQLAAMKMARSSGALLTYDVNLRLTLWPSEEAARQGILDVWKDVDVIKLSDDELRFLVKEQDGSSSDRDDELVRSLWHRRLKLLLVTHGSKGCRYYTPKFHGEIRSIQVDAVVDTTGAGDAFMGGFLFQLAKDTSLLHNEELLKKALEFSNACGALATTGRGAIPALPSHESVSRLFASR